jgi:hypothetical protein
MKAYEEYCFIIQPFDGAKFEKRYNDVFKPALNEINLEAYRVDKDSAVTILIETIEEKIKKSRFCLADITTDNPNVWYEVGYAIASKKDIILLCSDERKTNYPFDIQHRAIINYTVESTSDFSALSNRIKDRARSLLNNPVTVEPPIDINADISGLSYQEIILLGSILNNQSSPDEGVSSWTIMQDMSKSGLNNIAFNISSRKLLQKKLIEISHEGDYNGNGYAAYNLTQPGNIWVLENSDKFDTRIVREPFVEEKEIDNDLPF